MGGLGFFLEVELFGSGVGFFGFGLFIVEFVVGLGRGGGFVGGEFGGFVGMGGSRTDDFLEFVVVGV